MNRIVVAVAASAALVPALFAAQVRPVFELNRGQADASVRALARSGHDTLLITDFDALLVRRAADGSEATLRIVFPDAIAPRAELGRALPSRSNYLRGQDPSRWITGVPHVADLHLRGAGRGVDARFHADRGAFELDLDLAPGVTRTRLAFEDARCALRDDGSLAVDRAGVVFDIAAPRAWQDTADGRRDVAVHYALESATTVAVEVFGADPALAVRVDPMLGAVTYLGGSAPDFARAIAVHPSGDVLVAGSTQSVDFPLAAAMDGVLGGGSDAFVARLDPNTLAPVFLTFLGGSSVSTLEGAYGIGASANGAIVVAGVTDSSDFPITAGAPQTVFGGATDAFVVRMNAFGSALLDATYLGGSGADGVADLAVSSIGSYALSGTTTSSDFPLQNAVQASATPHGDVFAASFSALGALDFSTLLGTDGVDQARAVAISAMTGDVVVGGVAAGNGLALTPQPFRAFGNGFLARLSSSGAAVAITKFTGVPSTLAIDDGDSIWLAGSTADSSGVPTSYGCYQRLATLTQGQVGSSTDSILVRMAPNLAALEAGTFFGISTRTEATLDLALTAQREPVVLVREMLHFFPYAVSTYVETFDVALTTKVSRFALPAATQDAAKIALDASNRAFVAGFAGPGLATTSGAAQTAWSNFEDGFVLRVDETPATAPIAVRALPAKVRHGESADLVLVRNGPAPSGGVVLSLTSSDPSVVVPAQVLVPDGARSVTTTLATSLVPAPLSATITASWGAASVQTSVAVWHGPYYELEMISQFGASESTATTAINGVGQVCGGNYVWTPGVGSTPLTWLPTDLNDAGVAAVAADFVGYSWSPSTGYTKIPAPGATPMIDARGIDNLGRVCGTMMSGSSGSARAFLWTPGQAPKNLGSLGNGLVSRGNDVSTSGYVVGEAQTPSFGYTPFRWSNATGLVNLGLPPGANHATAYGVNEAGAVVGGTLAAGGAGDAWRWVEGSGFKVLGRLPGDKIAHAADLDEQGVAVGTSFSTSNEPRVFVHSDVDGMLALDDTLDPIAGWLFRARRPGGINASSDVAANVAYYGGSPAAADNIIASMVAHPIGPRFASYGVGWAGTLGVPKLTATARPALCAPIGIAIQNAAGTTTSALLVLSGSAASMPLGMGPTLLVTPTVTVGFALPAAGITLGGSIPCDPALVGVAVYLQVLELDPGASGGVAATPGLKLTIG